MDTNKIIARAMEEAQRAKDRGASEIRLPVLAFNQWAAFHDRPDILAEREAHRAFQKRNFYFKRFLEELGLEVLMVACLAEDVLAWAEESGHALTGSQEKGHALAHFVNRPEVPPSQCVHKRPETASMAGSDLRVFATITAFGETEDDPEIISTVIHTRDGTVVDSLELLAVRHTLQEAFDLATDLIHKHAAAAAFHDRRVRRPEYCPDCNELLLNVASEMEYQQIEKQS